MTETAPLGARGIAETLRRQILAGAFGKGGSLPSSRALAAELSVSRTTVTAAYEQLLAEGLIRVGQGRRPSVAPDLDPSPERAAAPAPLPRLSAFGQRLLAAPKGAFHPQDRQAIDFRYGDLAAAEFPAMLWKRAMVAALAQKPLRLSYADPRGSERLRKALQAYLWRARRISCTADQIMIVSGSQQGLDLAARLLLDPDDAFVFENPGYAMARQALAGTGASAVPLAVDRDGLRTGDLAGIAARLAYVTPSHQYPLGGVMPMARRLQLLDWAKDHAAWVIEDDYDSEYRYDINPVPPLHGLGGTDRVIYLGTVSKTLSPLLRLGYLVVPPVLAEAVTAAKRLTDRHSPTAEQEALAALIESGAYERHVRQMRRLNGARRAALIRALTAQFGSRITIEGADAGLHLVVWFHDLAFDQEAALVARAKRAGLGVYGISPLYDPEAPRQVPDRLGLVMGYASVALNRIDRGVALLAQAVAAS